MNPRVQTGVEALAAEGYRRLAGLRVGLVTNPTGILPDLTSTIDALHRAPGVKLRALFGPEHGVRGDVPAGDAVEGSPARVGSSTRGRSAPPPPRTSTIAPQAASVAVRPSSR